MDIAWNTEYVLHTLHIYVHYSVHVYPIQHMCTLVQPDRDVRSAEAFVLRFLSRAPPFGCTSVGLHRHLSTSGDSRNPHHWSEILSCTFRDTTRRVSKSRTVRQGYETWTNPGIDRLIGSGAGCAGCEIRCPVLFFFFQRQGGTWWWMKWVREKVGCWNLTCHVIYYIPRVYYVYTYSVQSIPRTLCLI